MARRSEGLSKAFHCIALLLLVFSLTFFTNRDVTGISRVYRRDGFFQHFRHANSVGVTKTEDAGLVVKRPLSVLGDRAAWPEDVSHRSNSTKRQTSKRADDGPIESAIAKGKTYWDLIQDQSSHHQSPLTLKDATGVERNGFFKNGWVRSIGTDWQAGVYPQAFDALRISANGFSNINIRLLQSDEYRTCGELRQPTNAKNFGSYNINGKSIVSQYNYSPNFMLRRSKGIPRGGRLSNEQAQELPLVRQWSDLVWLAWTSLARTPGTGPGQLKYIFKQHVVTQETVTVIEDVFDLEEDEMPNPGTADWPGEKFTPGKDGFWALLGTPHGRGIAYLIAEHPNDLGGKSIEYITVWEENGEDSGVPEWQLLFALTGDGN